MGLHHRKLSSQLDCESLCHDQSCSSKKSCDDCIKDCNLYNYYTNPPLPPTPIYKEVDDVNKHSKHSTISTYLIITFALVSTTFFLVCCYAIYAKFFRSRRRVSSQQQTQQNHDEFLDEEHGPMVDHPIWYIRTAGLDQSIITAITVCKYKKGEGLIEGTDCSVCLSEFEEDESVRLLPKCNHAFHLPCIDTWLRSHTNCPMCRAPIVTTNHVRIPSLEPNVVDSSSLANSQMESLENSDDVLRNGADHEAGAGEVEVEDGRRVCEAESLDAEVNMQPRRSVSLDDYSAAKINLALATVQSVESNGNSKRVGGNENLATGVKGSSSFRITRYLQSAPSSMKRSRSFNGKHLLSRYSTSHKKPNALVRSF